MGNKSFNNTKLLARREIPSKGEYQGGEKLNTQMERVKKPTFRNHEVNNVNLVNTKVIPKKGRKLKNF